MYIWPFFKTFSGSCNRPEMINDNHCGSFWACDGDVFAPFCCPRGLRFNNVSKTCDYDPFTPCVAPCPNGYTIRKFLLCVREVIRKFAEKSTIQLHCFY